MKLEVLEYSPDTKQKDTPVLFIHGAFHAAWCWEANFLPYFSSKGFSCYALSLRGHGNSDGHEDIHSFSLNDYMHDVLGIIKSFNTKPFLVGHSMGGAIVQKILHLQPDTIKGAVLMASVPPDGLSKKHMAKYIFLRLFGNRSRNLARVYFSKELPEEKLNHFVSLLKPESRKASFEQFKRIVPNRVVNKVPVLVLGSKEDPIISEKATVRIGRKYKSSTIIFPNVSHDMMLDPYWKIVADHIMAFLYEK